MATVVGAHSGLAHAAAPARQLGLASVGDLAKSRSKRKRQASTAVRLCCTIVFVKVAKPTETEPSIPAVSWRNA